jgi:diguanylate cyclase (GGDEF)-like protein
MQQLVTMPSFVGEDTAITRRPRVVRTAVKQPVLVAIGGGRRRFWECSSRELVIGRDLACHVPVPTDQAASRRHARVRPRRGARHDPTMVEIEDLGSLNGTLVNNVPITGPHLLAEHDTVRIGTSDFKFMLRDEDELAGERELLVFATHDALTGLLNRGAFDQQLAVELVRARRYQRPLALVMVDVDHFKRVNDQYGHVTGDRVLSAAGLTVKSCLRACDHAGRFGGEEFVVVLPETTLDGAFLAGERIRRAIADMVVHAPAAELRVTVSVGVAQLASAEDDAFALIGAADRALYQAKQGGRDRTCASPV